MNNLKEHLEFKKGDKVEWCGLLGTVEYVDYGSEYPVHVCGIPSENVLPWRENFTLCGRLFLNHTKPSLILIERAKIKKKMKIEAWANVYENGEINLYENELDAREGSAFYMGGQI